MVDYIVGAILAVVVIAAVTYIVKAKRKGQVCIGCSNSGSCSDRKSVV